MEARELASITFTTKNFSSYLLYFIYIFLLKFLNTQKRIIYRKSTAPKKLDTKNGCSTNPVGEKSPTGFFTCKKEKSEL